MYGKVKSLVNMKLRNRGEKMSFFSVVPIHAASVSLCEDFFMTMVWVSCFPGG